MAAKNGKQSKPDGRAKLVMPNPAEDERVIYSNYVQVNHTPWDFAVHFGNVVVPTIPTPAESGEIQIPVKRILTVNIPAPLVRGIIKALQTNLEQYEKRYGEIKIPKGNTSIEGE